MINSKHLTLATLLPKLLSGKVTVNLPGAL